MALRGSPSRRMIGNPMGGLLRDIDRRSRSTTRRSSRSPSLREASVVPLSGPAELPPHAAAVVQTDSDGRGRFEYGHAGFAGVPVVTAVPVAPVSSDATVVVFAVLEQVDQEAAVVRVWRLGDVPLSPAGPGVCVHITAVEETS